MEKPKIVAKLSRTRASIYAHVRRGGSLKSQRGMELLDRYNDLKEALSPREERYSPEWLVFCESNGSCPSHDGYDLFC